MQPLQKHCRHCNSGFEIAAEDFEFYDKISPVFAGKKYPVPPPSLCPDCRQQRRLAWRNERVLYPRDCDLCERHIVSVYSGTAPFPVYCMKCWWSDKWDPLSFGIPYDQSVPFLDQFHSLKNRVPHLTIQNDDGIGSENCEYCYDISHCKDCYRLIGSWYDQECHYCLNVNRSKNVVDCNTVGIDSELVYESVDSQHLYRCAYLQNCENCNNCFFGFDLKGCSDCIACFGLRQKKFHIFNQPYSEAEYRTKLQQLPLGSYSVIQDLRSRYDAWALALPRKYANLQNCEDSAGNNLLNCRNVLGWSVFDSEGCKYVDRSDRPKFCYDLINTGGPQWCCDCVTPDDSYMTHFSIWCWKSKNIFYSDNCHSSEHLLGCISMHRGRYCILNKQYSKDDYERIAGQIIDSLSRTGDWGELLAVSLAPFAYNESAALEYYPLAKDEVLRRGWRWKDDLPYTTGKETKKWDEIPDDIADVPDSITDEVLACTECKRNFRLIPGEVALYRQLPAPIPRLCPDCRHLKRFKRKTPTKIWNRQCDKCSKAIITSYPPESPERIYCESCYLNEVY